MFESVHPLTESHADTSDAVAGSRFVAELCHSQLALYSLCTL